MRQFEVENYMFTFQKIISESSSTDLPVFRGPSLTIYAPNSLFHLKDKKLPNDVKIVSSGLLAISSRNKTPVEAQETWISLQNCNWTRTTDFDDGKLYVGSSFSLTEVRNAFASLGNPKLNEIIWFLDQFSSTHVRNNAVSFRKIKTL